MRHFFKYLFLTSICIFGLSQIGSYTQLKGPPGEVFAFAGLTCPAHSVAADGTLVSESGTYANLYAAIGASWGTDGSGNINLPDMRGNFPRGDTLSLAGGTISAIGSNEATIGSHGFHHSGVPVQVTGTAPTGLSNSTTYWEIYVDSTHIKFATTLTNALGGTAISISGSTGGTVVQWVDPDSGSRVQISNGGNADAYVGSEQDYQLQAHTHTVSVQYGTTSGYGTFVPNSVSGGVETYTSSSTGGTETRSRNVYIHYCIWY